jgi:hypothetical protein
MRCGDIAGTVVLTGEYVGFPCVYTTKTDYA